MTRRRIGLVVALAFLVALLAADGQPERNVPLIGVLRPGIVGADAEGRLLLAVLPLPETEAVAAEGTYQRAVTFAHGQILTIDITVDEGTKGDDGAYLIKLTAVTALLPGPHRATAPVLRIGLVEDDPFLRQALESLLRSIGLHVEALAPAEAFLEQAPQVHIDCLVCLAGQGLI
jgi:hypothetical protein